MAAIGPAAQLNVLVSVHASKASAELNKFARVADKTADSTRRSVRNIDSSSAAFGRLGGAAGRANKQVRKLLPGLSLATRIPVYKIAAIGAAIQAIIPPVVALTSALAPLAGLLGALPGLASAAAQGIGTMLLGFKGIGDAIGAALDAQKNAGKEARSSLQSQRASAEGVRQAVMAVGDAERSLADANRGSRDAQEDLSQARRDAARDLVDLRLAVQGAVLSEKEARLELSQAVKEQADTYADTAASGLDLRNADLAVERARLGLKEATVDAKRSQDDYNESQRKGIKGADGVVSAQRSLKDANRGVADAQRGLVEATRQVRLAQADQAQGAVAASAGVEKLQQAMADLPPAGRNFARFIIGLKPRLDDLRDAAASGIFPGLTRGIQAATGNFGVFRTIVAQTGKALGDLGEQTGRRLGSAEWGRDLQVQGERNVETIGRLGRAALNLGDGFRHIMLAAGPLVSFLTRSAERFSAVFASWAKGARESGQLARFFQETIKTTKIVTRAFWDFGKALINVGEIADRVWGQDLLKGIGKVASKFREWTESVRGQRAIEGYFERWRERWVAIGDAVKDVIGEYLRLRREGKSVADALAHVISDTLAKLIPRLFDQGVQMGWQIAKGIGRGFIDANPLGRLLLGTYILGKFGLLKPLIAAAGTKAGAAWATSATTAAAAGTAAGGTAVAAASSRWQLTGSQTGAAGAARAAQTRSAATGATAAVGAGAAAGTAGRVRTTLTKLGPMVKGIGAGVLAIQLMTGIADGITHKGLTSIGDRIQQGLSTTTFGLIPAPEEIRKKLGRAIEFATRGGSLVKPGFSRTLFGNLSEGLDDQQKRLIRKLHNLRQRAVAMFGPDAKLRLDVAVNPGQALKNLNRLRDGLDRLKSGAIVTLDQLRTVTRNNVTDIAATLGTHTKAGMKAMTENFRGGVKSLRGLLRSGVITTGQFGKEIARLLDLHTGEGKEAAKKNLFAARKAIAQAMGGAVRITSKGAGQIRKIYAKELSLYGFNQKEIAFRLEGKEFSGKSGEGMTLNQRGSYINQGKPYGDSVPSMLEKGEYVLNRKAVQKAGKQNLDRLNFQDAPRFQQGGGVGGMVAAANRLDKAGFPYLWGGGHQASPAPFGPMDCSGAVSYVLQHGGVQIPTMVSGALAGAGSPGPGKVTVFANPTHTFMRIGNRYFGTSGSNPGGGAGWFPDPGDSYKSGFTQRHFAASGRMAGMGKVGELQVAGGADSALRDMAQGALDRTRRAANQRLREAASLTLGAGDVGDPGPGADVKGSGSGLMKQISAKLGWNFADWWEIDRRETGHGTNLTNPTSSARLRGQFLDINYGKYGPGSDPSKNPSMAQQIWSMAKYIKARYTNPTKALQHHDQYNWYQKGGLVQALAKGGLVGYIGDSLGVGTAPKLARMIGDYGLRSDVKESRPPSAGPGLLSKYLGKNFKQFVFDLGSNTGGSVSGALRAFDRKTGKRPVHAFTLKGEDADARNAALRSVAGGDVDLIPWAKQKANLDSMGLHPDDEGYRKRARLAAAVIKRARSKVAAGTPGSAKKLAGLLGRQQAKQDKVAPGSPGQALKKLSKGGTNKQRKARMAAFRAAVKGMDLPAGLKAQMGLLDASQALYGERADRALTLKGDEEGSNPQVLGATETQWVEKQLQALWSLRNAMIRADQIFKKKQDEIAKLVVKVKAQIKKLEKQIATFKKRRDNVAKVLKQLKGAKPKGKKQKAEHAHLVEQHEKLLAGLDKQQKGRKTVKSQLELAAPILTGRGTTLKTQAAENLDALTTVQGSGSSMELMMSLPPIDTLGGSIFEVRHRLLELGKASTATDTSTATSDRTALLEQLLREANLRTTVSERALATFANFPRNLEFPYAGQFHTGGVIGGTGEAVAVVQGGEGVFTREQMAAMGDPNVTVKVVVQDGAVDKNKIRAEVEKATRSMSRNAGRGLGGRGGGGL